MEKNENKIRNTPLLVLAIPILIEMLMAYMVPLFDIYFLSGVSNESIAGVSAVMPILLLGMSLVGAFQVAGVSVCSKLIGANNISELAKVQTYFIILMFSVGIILSLVYVFSSSYVAGFLKLEKGIASEAVNYYQIWGGCIFLFAVYIAFCILLIVRGRMKYIIISGALMNIVNIALGYALIGGNWGIEARYAEGAAIASAIAWLVADIAIIYCALRFCEIKFTLGFARVDAHESLKPLFKIAIPGLIEPLSYQFAQMVIVMFVVTMSDLSLVARAYLMNFFLITSIWNIAMANAIQTKVANSIGSNLPDQAERDVKTALRIGIGGSLLIAGGIALFGRQVMGIYTEDQQVVDIVLGLLWVSVLIEVGRSMNIIMGGVLRASGSPAFVAYTGVICTWGLGVGLGYSLAFGFGIGFLGVWLAMLVDENVRGIVGLLRWKRGGWRKSISISQKEISSVTYTTSADGVV